MPATARHISCNCTCASACTSSYGSGGAGSGSGVCFYRRLPYPALGHCPLHLSCRRLAQLLLCPILVHNSGFGVVHSISSVIAPCKNQRKQARHTREQTNSQPVCARWAVVAAKQERACRHATARDATLGNNAPGGIFVGGYWLVSCVCPAGLMTPRLASV